MLGLWVLVVGSEAHSGPPRRVFGLFALLGKSGFLSVSVGGVEVLSVLAVKIIIKIRLWEGPTLKIIIFNLFGNLEKEAALATYWDPARLRSLFSTPERDLVKN